MKTIREYLGEMQEPERSQAIFNAESDANPGVNIDSKNEFGPDDGSNKQRAIARAFIWSKTKQGRDYWVEISNKYKGK